MKKLVLAIIAAVLALLITVFFFGDHSFQTAPYSLPAAPMVASRIVGQESDLHLFRHDPNTIHGYAIVQQQAVVDTELRQDVRDVLNSRLIYGMANTMCFEPGIAIRFGDGQDAIDALICLSCRHIYFFHGDQIAYTNLNSTGVARIKALYVRLFPGHSPDEPEDDALRIAGIRDKEREKREEAMANAATLPTPEPTTSAAPSINKP